MAWHRAREERNLCNAVSFMLTDSRKRRRLGKWTVNEFERISTPAQLTNGFGTSSGASGWSSDKSTTTRNATSGWSHPRESLPEPSEAKLCECELGRLRMHIPSRNETTAFHSENTRRIVTQRTIYCEIQENRPKSLPLTASAVRRQFGREPVAFFVISHFRTENLHPLSVVRKVPRIPYDKAIPKIPRKFLKMDMISLLFFSCWT
jgi:hypothetical protein